MPMPTSFSVDRQYLDYTPQCTVSLACGVACFSYYLERLFKQETSETPRSYLEKIRVDKATHLLHHTDRTNLEICYEVGFQSPSNFYKVFRRMKNCTPSEYRNFDS